MIEELGQIDLANPDHYVEAIPFAWFDRLRHDHPVVWHPEQPPNRGFWAITRHDDLTAIHMDWETFSSEIGAVGLEELDEEQLQIRNSMLETDPPRHTQMRKICSKRFSARGVGVYQEPGIDRDAMPAHAGARRQDVDARMTVGEPDHFPHVDAQAVGEHRKLVGESDIDVAERILGEFRHLRRTRGSGDAGAADEATIELKRLARAARRHAADHAVVVDQFDEDAAGQHALGAIGDPDVRAAGAATGHLEIGTELGEQVADLLRGADRRSRFRDAGGPLTGRGARRIRRRR